jgi:hypothetical protein
LASRASRVLTDHDTEDPLHKLCRYRRQFLAFGTVSSMTPAAEVPPKESATFHKR